VTTLTQITSIAIGLFVILLAIFLPVSIIVGAVRRWFWFGVVARAWATVEQAKNREVRINQSEDRALDAYRTLRDALMEDANTAGQGRPDRRQGVLTRISQAAAALEDELPELKPHVDQILRHARPNSFYDVGRARQLLEPIAARVNQGNRPPEKEPAG
jgi:hypothetical protein